MREGQAPPLRISRTSGRYRYRYSRHAGRAAAEARRHRGRCSRTTEHERERRANPNASPREAQRADAWYYVNRPHSGSGKRAERYANSPRRATAYSITNWRPTGRPRDAPLGGVLGTLPLLAKYPAPGGAEHPFPSAGEKRSGRGKPLPYGETGRCAPGVYFLYGSASPSTKRRRARSASLTARYSPLP